MDLGSALRRVEVGRRERQDDPVDRQELDHRALLLLVVPDLDVLRAAQRELGEHLLLLVPELLDLLGDLPVQEVTLALGALLLQVIDLADDLGSDRTVRRKHLLDSA